MAEAVGHSLEARTALHAQSCRHIRLVESISATWSVGEGAGRLRLHRRTTEISPSCSLAGHPRDLVERRGGCGADPENGLRRGKLARRFADRLSCSRRIRSSRRLRGPWPRRPTASATFARTRCAGISSRPAGTRSALPGSSGRIAGRLCQAVAGGCLHVSGDPAWKSYARDGHMGLILRGRLWS